jgi:Fur family transcriptional regulator, ferric uptake regulator
LSPITRVPILKMNTSDANRRADSADQSETVKSEHTADSAAGSAAASARNNKKSRQLADSIEAIIKDVPRGVHLTASEVFRRAREAGLDVSLSTVYRTLNALQQGGNVSTVSGEHGRRYEARDSDHDHDHLICLKCGLTIEFADDLIRGFGAAVAERKGYEHKSSRFDILGICAECKAKDEDHRVTTASLTVDNVINLLESATADLHNGANALESRKLAKVQDLLTATVQKVKDALEELETTTALLNSPAKRDDTDS